MISLLGTELDSYARQELIEHNLRLAGYVAKKFSNTRIEMEDLIAIASIGLIKGVNSYNPTKNTKLSTYISRCMENEILMTLRRENKHCYLVSLDAPITMDADGHELHYEDVLGTDADILFQNIEKEVEKQIIYDIISDLKEKEKEIIVLRYGIGTDGNGLTQKEVAAVTGISQSYVSRIEKAVLKRMIQTVRKIT